MIKLCASIVTALGMVVLVPLVSWALLATVQQGERITSLETWRGEGRRYTDVDAERDFGVVLQLIKSNKDDIIDLEEDVKTKSNRIEALKFDY